MSDTKLTTLDVETVSGLKVAGTAITATPAELNALDGITATVAELNTMDGITATVAELNALDGITATVAELNTMDGILATVTELNTMDGILATAAELNTMDGITATTAELNILDGVLATYDEINKAADATALALDGLVRMAVARATYDFAVNGGEISAIGLGVTIPDNAIVCGGFVDVVTTCTSAAADAGTMALSVQGANDIVSAIAISDGTNPWDAGLKAIVPKANTPESTGIKLTAAREITATIATQVFTAGKFNIFLYYLVGD